MKRVNINEYLIGFFMSCILTLIPLITLRYKLLNDRFITYIIVISAILQILTHIIFFLHINENCEKFWNILSLTFTVLIILITLFGSTWVMYNLNLNMIMIFTNFINFF